MSFLEYWAEPRYKPIASLAQTVALCAGACHELIGASRKGKFAGASHSAIVAEFAERLVITGLGAQVLLLIRPSCVNYPRNCMAEHRLTSVMAIRRYSFQKFIEGIQKSLFNSNWLPTTQFFQHCRIV